MEFTEVYCTAILFYLYFALEKQKCNQIDYIIGTLTRKNNNKIIQQLPINKIWFNIRSDNRATPRLFYNNMATKNTCSNVQQMDLTVKCYFLVHIVSLLNKPHQHFLLQC